MGNGNGGVEVERPIDEGRVAAPDDQRYSRT